MGDTSQTQTGEEPEEIRYQEIQNGSNNGEATRQQVHRETQPKEQKQSLIRKARRNFTKFMTSDLEQKIFQEILRKAIPCSLQQFVWFISRLTQISVIGYYGGKAEIAGISLGFSFISTFGWSVMLGFSGALDTYCSQAFTANKKTTGLYVQRYWILMLLVCTPMACMYYNSAAIMQFIGQDPEVSYFSQLYARIMIIDLIPAVIYISLEKFLQAQGIFTPILVLQIGMLPVFCTTQYFCVFKFFGFQGAAIGVVICEFIQTTILCIYVAYFQGFEAWGGFSREAFSELLPFSLVGMSSTIQVCTEWWAVEIQTIFCGWVSVTALAAQTLVFNASVLIWSLYLGVSQAGGVQVGNYMGSGNAKEAKQTVKFSILINFALALLVAALLIVYRGFWVRIYTNDPDILETAKAIIPITAIGGIFDALQGTAGGLLRGLGHQYIGAFINTFSFYVIAIPLSLFLAFYLGLGLEGIWYSLGVAFFLQAVILLTYLHNVDYDKAVLEAYDRVGQKEQETIDGILEPYINKPLLAPFSESDQLKV